MVDYSKLAANTRYYPLLNPGFAIRHTHTFHVLC